MVVLHPAAVELITCGADPYLPRYFLTSATLRATFEIDLPDNAQVYAPHDLFAFDLLDQAPDGGVMGDWATHRIVVDAAGDPWVAAVERTMHAHPSIDGIGSSYRVVFGIGLGPNRLDPIVNLDAQTQHDVKIPRDDAVWLASFVRRFAHGLQIGAIRLSPAREGLSRPVRRALGPLVGENMIANFVPPEERIARSTPPSKLIVPPAYHSTSWRDAALGPYRRGKQKQMQQTGGILVPDR